MTSSNQNHNSPADTRIRDVNVIQSPRNDVILQKYSLELIGVVDEMSKRRDVLHKQILNDEKEKEKLQQDIRHLTGRLVKINETLCDKVVARNALDQTIMQTNETFEKLVSTSENLTTFMKKVTSSIRPILIAVDEQVKDEEALNGGKKKKTNRQDGMKR